MDNYPWDIEFENFILKYDTFNPKIALKIKHMRETEIIAKTIAEMLDLTQEEIKLSSAIGLLHDLGRFLQIEKFDTFDDSKSMDHAKASVLILFGEGLINKFYPNINHHWIIERAIYNHNKFSIDERLTENEKMFCHIIRDADKIDIYRVMAYSDFYDAYFNAKTESLSISPDMRKAFYDCKLIKNMYRKTPVDDLILKLGYVFDLHFEESKKILLDKGYLDLCVNSFIEKSVLEDESIKQELLDMLEFAKRYIS